MTALPATSLHVLVIDDDAVMRELLFALLSGEGYTVHASETGEAALGLLRSDVRADVVLCDMQLPGLCGAGLHKQLREAAPQASLVGMSGSEPVVGDRTSVDAFLLKPFSMEQFANALRSAEPFSAAAAQAADEAAASLPPEVLKEATYAYLARSIPPAQMAELCRLTLADVDARVESLQAARDKRDPATYKREAHALKGGCGMVGATELAALAAQAEAGSLDDTPTDAEFLAAAKRLRSIMTARCNLTF